MASTTQHNFTSIILTVPKELNQFQACLDYIQEKHPQITRHSPNLHLVNLDGDGVKIAQVRQILEKANYGAYGGGVQFFIILQADQSSLPAQNAMLKILEEPAVNTQIILSTSNPNLLLPTIRSRCLTQIHPNLHKARQNKAQAKITSPANLNQQWQEILDTIININSFSIQKAFDLAEKYKNRDEAQEMCEEVIKLLNSVILDQKSDLFLKKRATLICSHLLKAYQDLKNNFNPQLVLEHYFLSLTRI